MIEKVNLSPSQLAQMFFVGEDGKKFDLTGYEYLLPIYNKKHRHKLLMAGRGVAKSTTLAAKSILNCCFIPSYSILYTNSSFSQAGDFSHQKLDIFLKSPLIKKFFLNDKCLTNVWNKTFASGSSLLLRSSSGVGDRIRGIHVNMLLNDEMQDTGSKSLQVIQEVLTGKQNTCQISAGTPKSLQNPMETMWTRSTQNIWHMKCPHCNFDNIPLLDMITHEGLVCHKCRKLISPRDGIWIPDAPSNLIDGYRIPQIMLPGIDWNQLTIKTQILPAAVVANELMGESSEESLVPLTRKNILDCCDPNLIMKKEMDKKELSYSKFIGIDWGAGAVSYTILSVMSNLDGKPSVIYTKRYSGAESATEVMFSDILKQIEYWKPTWIGADYGFGYGLNSRLLEKFKNFFIIESTGGEYPPKFDENLPGYKIAKNRSVADFVEVIKSKRIRFPREKDFEPFIQDFLNERIEINALNNSMKYFNPESFPDDALFSIMYAYFAFSQYYRMKKR